MAEVPLAVAAELAKAPDPAAQEEILQAWQARRSEVAEFFAHRSRGWQIADTRRSKCGQIFDYVVAETLYPDAPDAPFATPPPPTRKTDDAPVERALTEFETDPSLTPPPGTIPVVRPHLDPYVNGEVRARSLQEYMDLAWTKPAPSYVNERLYGTHRDVRANTGTAGHINVWDYKEVGSGEMSLLQTAALCWGTSGSSTLEAIEVGFQKLPSLYGDDKVHLFTFFRTAGGATGDRVGGYNTTVGGFIQAANAPFPPGVSLNPSSLSTLDGEQRECRIEVQLSGGNWWIEVCNSWIGYYPTQNSSAAAGSRINFDLIGSGTCEIQWYGETADPTPTTWSNVDMGSGRFAAEGFARAAYIREPFLLHGGGVTSWLSSPVPGTGNGYDPDCYTLSPIFENGGSIWNRWFYVGGPGGNNPGCN